MLLIGLWFRCALAAVFCFTKAKNSEENNQTEGLRETTLRVGSFQDFI